MWDHCMLYMMYTINFDEEKKEWVSTEPPLKIISFFYTDNDKNLATDEDPVYGFLGLRPPPEIKETIEDLEKLTRPQFVTFQNFAVAMTLLSKDGWEAVSHSDVVDRYAGGLGRQNHVKVLFKRPAKLG